MCRQRASTRLTVVVGAVGRGRYLVLGAGVRERSHQCSIMCLVCLCVCGSVVCEGLTARREGSPAPLSLRPPLAKWNREGWGIRRLEVLEIDSSWVPGPSSSARMSREHPSSTGMVSGLSRAKARGEKDRGDQRGHGCSLTTTTALRRAGAMGVRRTGADVDCALLEQEQTHRGSRRVSVSLQVSFWSLQEVFAEAVAPSEPSLGRGKHDRHVRTNIAPIGACERKRESKSGTLRHRAPTENKRHAIAPILGSLERENGKWHRGGGGG